MIRQRSKELDIWPNREVLFHYVRFFCLVGFLCLCYLEVGLTSWFVFLVIKCLCCPVPPPTRGIVCLWHQDLVAHDPSRCLNVFCLILRTQGKRCPRVWRCSSQEYVLKVAALVVWALNTDPKWQRFHVFFNKLLCAFVMLAPFKMQSPGKGPSCSALRMLQDVSGYYLEIANTVLPVKKWQPHRRARTIGLTHWCIQATRPESAQSLCKPRAD